MPKKLKKSGEENAVHVRLDNPLPLRKDVLSTVLGAVNMLNVYSEVADLRKRRVEMIGAMADIMKDAQKEIKKLENEYLPQLPIGEYKSEHKAAEFKTSAVSEIKREETYDDEVERLKAEIESIDRKLSSL